MSKTDFKPSVAFHPGEYIKDIIDDMGVSQSEFAKRLGINDKMLSELVNGKIRISKEVAKNLSSMLGTSPSVWLNMQAAFDEYEIEENIETDISDELDILKDLKYDFFAKQGFVDETRKRDERVRQLRSFFQVGSLKFLLDDDPLVSYRKSSNVDERNKLRLNAWVQTALRLGRDVPTIPYNPQKLMDAIPEIRKMTTQDPSVFSSALVDLLKDCGVALVIIPHMEGSKINGFVRWINKEKAVLAINVRGAYADIFWFTLFHELKHVMQHRTKEVFISFANKNDEIARNEVLEAEADRYARDQLIPPDAFQEFVKQSGPYFSHDSIVAFSESINILPSIVVGRLQKEGRCEYSHHAKLKTRYQIAS